MTCPFFPSTVTVIFAPLVLVRFPAEPSVFVAESKALAGSNGTLNCPAFGASVVTFAFELILVKS